MYALCRFGLSYTTFSITNLRITPTAQSGTADDFAVDVEVTVTNTGPRAGTEVVQLYVSLPDVGLTTPRLQLRAFAKARDLAPGESKRVALSLDKYAVSYWDTRGQQWKAAAGQYGVHIGKSSEDIVLESEFAVEKGFTWVGL